MSRRRKQKDDAPPPPPGAGATPLSGVRLAMAYELAKHGIAMLFPDAEIIRSIVEQCKTTERSAAAALRSVTKLGARLTEQEEEELRQTLHFRYERLYAAEAQAGRHESAAKMLDRRARLAGLFKEQKQKGIEAEPDEFEGRTEADLDYYTKHGYFPEDKPPANVIQLDPLAAIRKTS